MKLLLILTFVATGFLLNVGESSSEDLPALRKKLIATFNRIKASARTPGVGPQDCSASLSQTISWAHLKDLFEVHEKTKGVLTHARSYWPFYSRALKEVLDDSAKDIVYCNWIQWTDQMPICLNGTCGLCSSYKPVESQEFRDLCQSGTRLQSAQDKDKDEARIKELKETSVISKPKEGSSSGGPLTFEEVKEWHGKLPKTPKDIGSECDTFLNVSVSATYLGELWEGRSEAEVKKEWSRHREFYGEKLQWLKGAKVTEPVGCGKGLVCGWEGTCFNCTLSTWILGNEVLEICSTQEAESWEKANGITTTEGMETQTGNGAGSQGGRMMSAVVICLSVSPFLSFL